MIKLKTLNRLPRFARTMSSSFKCVQGPYNWVNNQRVEPIEASGIIKNLEPRSGKLLAQVPISGTSEVDRVVQTAKKAFKSWSKVT